LFNLLKINTSVRN